MEFLQEIAISHGIHFNPAYMHTLHVMQEHSPSIEAAAINVFARSQHNYNGGLVSPDYHHQLAEGMDETTLLQPPSNPHLHNIDSLITNSVGLSTNNSTRHQFCEVSNIGSASVAAYLPCTIKRRSWQEALSSPKIDMSTSTQLHLVDMHPRVECTSVDNILNLQHIQAGATNHSTNPNYLMPKTLLTSSATHKMPLEESLIAAHEKGIPAQNPNRRSFLSALSEGDEAFFKQQLLVPMEGICIDVPIKQGATVSNDREEVCYDQLIYDPDVLQHGFDDHNLSIAQLWIPNQSTSGITDRSSTPSKNMSNKSIGSSCAAAVNMCMSSKDNDEKSRASQEMNALREPKEDITRMCTSINIDSSRSEAQYDMGRINVNGGSNQKAALPHDIMNPLEALIDSKKRSFADHASAAYNMTHSKRAHLGPDHGKHSNNNILMKHSSSSSSLNMSDMSNIDTHKSSSLHSSKSSAKSSSRNQLGPALNTNLKPRARHGTANDPQTLAARNRRERINARLKVLQELVPNGSKVDLVTMLEKAINYVKFLQLQLRVLSNDEFWQANQLEKVAMQHVLSMDVEEDNFNNSDHLTICEHTSMSCTTNNTFIDQL